MKRIEVHEFPNTVFEYYPGEKVLARTSLLGCDTTLTLYKPGIFCNPNKGYAKCPVLTINMLGTGISPDGSFGILDRITGYAVSILNNERYGRIRTDLINLFDLGYNPERVTYRKTTRKTVYIPQSELQIGKIYQEENGRKTLYLGNSHLYGGKNNETYGHLNRTNNGISYSRFIYGSEELIDLIHKGIQVLPKDIIVGGVSATVYDVVIDNFWCCANYIDSYATIRKFVKEVGTIHLPENASFIRLMSQENYMKNTIYNSAFIIKRDSNSDHMKTPSFDLSNSGLATMVSLISL